MLAAAKIDKIEKHNEEIKAIFNAIRHIDETTRETKRKIGFHREEEKG